MKSILSAFFLILLVGCNKQANNEYLVNYVNPFIGTAPATTLSAKKHGHGSENNAQVIPAVTVPFGMTNWTPQTKATETKCLAPYYYTDSVINGFRGTHWLSGSCVQDYGSMTIMPLTGTLNCLTEERGSAFSHQKESATPYVYEVNLLDYNINVEMTATRRCGVLLFTFKEEGPAHIVVNPNSDEGQGYVQIYPESNELVGYNPVHRIYQGWGEKAGFSGYFVVRFSKPMSGYGVYDGEQIFNNKSTIQNKNNIGGYISFDAKKNEMVEVYVGTSFTSIQQARKNLEAEIAGKSFAQVKSELKDEWEKLLGKIKVEGENESDKVKFYTALYHSFLQPRTFNDADGSYPKFDGGVSILNSGEGNYYGDFSMWDIYRALQPFYNLIIPSTNAQMMQSMLQKAEQGQWLPIFPCWNSYTSAMIGDHITVSLADAYIKNVIDLDEKEYGYLLQNAFKTPESFSDYENGKGRRALQSYLNYGFIPLEDEVKESFHQKEQVSRTLEYAFDDFALSQIAAKIGDTINRKHLLKRGLNYKNVFSVQDLSVRGRFANGNFTANFIKTERMPYITEGTPWQYTWYVPHDIYGLSQLMGGEKAFADNLDQFFNSGQYWHGNEPGHQIPFLYNYCGQPWKTQKQVNTIMQGEYNSSIGGLSGNDDAGQMSAWYVFAALGFYPVCPSVPEYVISGPHFDKISIQLENGKTFTINAPGASKGDFYIQDASLNGQTYTKNYLNHFVITQGGQLDFTMGKSPNKTWGTDLEHRPFSFSR